MAKTRAQMVTEVCDTIGKKSTALARSGTLLQSRVIDFLNWGQRRIARAHNFDELNVVNESASTVSGVKSYPLTSGTNNLGLVRPKDIASVRLIDGASSRKLDRWSYRKFDRYFPYPSNYSNGRSSIYVRWGSNIELFRIPDSAYTLYIRYPQWASDLSSDSQTSDFDGKDELIITSAVVEAYLALEEYDDVEVWYALLLGRLKNAIISEGHIDWEPEAEASVVASAYKSGQPWLDPYGAYGDPLYGYSN